MGLYRVLSFNLPHNIVFLMYLSFPESNFLKRPQKLAQYLARRRGTVKVWWLNESFMETFLA